MPLMVENGQEHSYLTYFMVKTMNKQKQIEWHSNRGKAMVWLRETYPCLFSSITKPIKLGIHEDIISENKEGMPEKAWINHALRYYVNSTTYLKHMKPGASRFNLAGIPDGKVSEEAALFAKKALKDHKNTWAEKARKIKSAGLVLENKENKGAETTISLISPSPSNTRKILTLKKKSTET